MTYQIITLDEKKHSRTIYATFHYPLNDAADAKRVISLLQYLKTAKGYDKFMVHEIETDKAILLSIVFDSIIKEFAVKALSK